MEKKNHYKKDLSGVIHNHCRDYSSDATESFDEMVDGAKKAALDFIIFTDHNSVGLKADKRDKNYDGLQVVAGTEITPECKFVRFEDKSIKEDGSNGHLLIFDLDELPSDELIKKGICQDMIDFSARKGLLCYVAHPDHKGAKTFGVPSYRCKNFDVTGYIGFSIWDLMTDWQNNANGIISALAGYLFPSLVLKGPEPETLSRLDKLSKDRSFSIIGEIDQHAYKYKFFGKDFTIFKCGFSFRTIRTHVLLDDPKDTTADFKKDLLFALRAGHCYASLDYFNDATGFTFAVSAGEEKFIMGDTISHNGDEVTFKVTTPKNAEITVIKDGERYMKKSGNSLEFTAKSKGVYRIEVYKKSLLKLRPWIFSNTIRVI
ncbi:hypothetical protein ACFL2A_04880 [Thermodesulfobacteriota bacterium]